MPVDLARLADDLRAETVPLEALLAPLDASGWATPTPAPGWAVHDQVTHLAYFDGATTTALLDPDRFVAERDEARADTDDLTAMIAARYRDLSPTETLTWFDEARHEMLAAFSLADTFGATRSPTTALRHVAHIGVRASANSFRTRDLEPPDTGVYVALRAPGGRAAWRTGLTISGFKTYH